MITALQRPVFLTATTAWARWCVQQQRLYRHPNAEWSTVGRRYVHLQDHQAVPLARYDCMTGRILV